MKGEARLKALKKVTAITIDVLLAIAVLTALVIVLPNLFGVRTLAVLTGSMHPNYPVGSMVFVAPEAPENINPGDPISFVLDRSGNIVTHRVVEADREARSFITRGDANDVNDGAPVLYDNVLGVVRFHIPMLGYILGFVLTTSGKIIAATVIISLIILTMLFSSDKKSAIS